MSADEFGSGVNYHKVRFDFALTYIAAGRVPSEFCSPSDPNVPDEPSYIELWARQNPQLTARLLEAKRQGAKAMLADCIRIASDRAYRVDERKLMIDTRKYLAALWNAECNPKQVIEQTTTVRNQSPRDAYIADCVGLLGYTPATAAAEYDARAGVTVQ